MRIWTVTVAVLETEPYRELASSKYALTDTLVQNASQAAMRHAVAVAYDLVQQEVARLDA